MAVSDNIKQYREAVEEAQNLTKDLEKNLANSISAGLSNSINQITRLDKAATKIGKAQKKAYEESVDLTKDILEEFISE